jgi:hypothetical protein
MRWWIHVNKPFVPADQALKRCFDLVHRLFRQRYARLLGRRYQLHHRRHALPGHRSGRGHHRLDRVEKRPIPMVFQNAPAAFDGSVLAVVGRIIGQADMEGIVAHKVDHAPHALGATAMVFRAIIQINHPGSDRAQALMHRVPPLRQAVGEAVARDVGADAIDKEFVQRGRQDTYGGHQSRRLEIVIGRLGLRPTFAPTGKGPHFDGGVGIDGNPSDVVLGIRIVLDLAQLVEDGVSLGHGFCGLLLATFLGKSPRALSGAVIVWTVGTSSSR